MLIVLKAIVGGALTLLLSLLAALVLFAVVTRLEFPGTLVGFMPSQLVRAPAFLAFAVLSFLCGFGVTWYYVRRA